VPELKEDPRFKERDIRKKNREELTPIIEEKLKTKDTTCWVNVLNEKGIPSGEILSLESALNQEQVKHRQTLKKINTPGIGDIPLFNLTAKFDKTTAEVETPPPTLGQHTEELLKQFGYSVEEMKSLKEKEII
jgi:crotonobetainyl-CoA:carnitine CoA-transferase CaiB-like acyl-CoA transferase